MVLILVSSSEHGLETKPAERNHTDGEGVAKTAYQLHSEIPESYQSTGKVRPNVLQIPIVCWFAK